MSAAAFSVMSLFVKLASERLPVTEIVLARGGFTLVLSGLWLWRLQIAPWGNDRRRLLWRGLLGTCGLGCYFAAIARLDLAVATLLHQLNPVITAVLAVPLLGERLSRARIIALLLGLGGVYAVIHPELWTRDPASADWVGIAFAVTSAVFAAAAYVMVRSLRHTEHPLVVVFYFPIVTIPITLPLAWGELLWPTPLEWVYLFGMGIATQTAQVCLTRGLHALPAAPAMAVSYTQVVFAATWGWLLWSETLRGATLVGAALIIGGAWLGARGQNRKDLVRVGRRGAAPDDRQVDEVDDAVSDDRREHPARDDVEPAQK